MNSDVVEEMQVGREVQAACMMMAVVRELLVGEGQ